MIPDLLKSSIEHFRRGEDIPGITLVCPAVDGTAKKRYSRKKTGDRIRRYLHDELTNIIELATGKTLKFSNIAGIKLGTNSLEQVIYKCVRCGLLHEGELPNNIRLVEEFAFGCDGNDNYSLPSAFLRCLPFIVIGSPENKGLIFSPPEPTLVISSTTLGLNRYWGNLPLLLSDLKNA